MPFRQLKSFLKILIGVQYEILSAYADRADEAASFRMEDIKNDQDQVVLVIFWSC